MRTTRTRVMVTGGAGFIGSHLCEALPKRQLRWTHPLHRKLGELSRGFHRLRIPNPCGGGDQ
jgi:nucleoside-diphosphate-sugar epimerase